MHLEHSNTSSSLSAYQVEIINMLMCFPVENNLVASFCVKMVKAGARDLKWVDIYAAGFFLQ